MVKNLAQLGTANVLFDDAGAQLITSNIEDLWNCQEVTLSSAEAQTLGSAVATGKQRVITEITLLNDTSYDAEVHLTESAGATLLPMIVLAGTMFVWGSGSGRKFTAGQFAKLTTDVDGLKASASGIEKTP